MVNASGHVVTRQIDVDRYPALSAPNQKLIDSLELALPERDAEGRLNDITDVAIEFVDRKNEKALAIIIHAEQLAFGLGDSLSIARCLRIKGQVLSRLQESEDAMKAFQVSLGISGRHHFDRERLRALVAYGIVCIERSEYDKGLRRLNLAHDLARALMDTAYVEATLNNLGVLYYKLKDYSKAVNYWKASAESQNCRNARAFKEHVNMSLAYANLKDFNNAIKALNDCVTLCGDECSEESWIHINYASGFIFLGQKNYESAEVSLLKSYRLAQRTGNIRMLLDNIYLLADVYQKLRRTDLALLYLEEGEDIINKGVGLNLEITKVYQRFADLHLRYHDFEKAAFYQSKYIQLRDSIYNEDLTTSLMRAEANYMERYNEAKIASQKDLLLLKEEIINRQENIAVLAMLLALLTVLCCLILYSNYRFKQMMNRLLTEKIHQRTYELERSRNELLLTLRERDLIIEKAEREAVETVNTISGLCQTAREEGSQVTTHSYLKRIENTSGQLRSNLGALFSKTRVV